MKKDQAAATLAGLFKEGAVSPEELMVKVMHGDEKIFVKSKERRITTKMIDAAKTLLPYRLPRLNAIDAEVKTIEIPHEVWVAQMAAGLDDIQEADANADV